MSKWIGYLLFAVSSAMLWHFGFHNWLMYGALGLLVVFNSLLPRQFILWLLIAMAMGFAFTAGKWEPLVVFLIGLFSLGMVFQVMEG